MTEIGLGEKKKKKQEFTLRSQQDRQTEDRQAV